jgi:hypothetical protein
VPITVRCGCGRVLVFKAEAAGKTFGCPSCKAEVNVPAVDPNPFVVPKSITQRLDELESHAKWMRRIATVFGVLVALMAFSFTSGIRDANRSAESLTGDVKRALDRQDALERGLGDVTRAIRELIARLTVAGPAATPVSSEPPVIQTYSDNDRRRDIGRVKRWLERKGLKWEIGTGVKKPDGTRVYLLSHRDSEGNFAEGHSSLVLPAGDGLPGEDALREDGVYYWEILRGEARVHHFAVETSSYSRFEVTESRVNEPGSLDAIVWTPEDGRRWRLTVRDYRPNLEMLDSNDGKVNKPAGLPPAP